MVIEKMLILNVDAEEIFKEMSDVNFFNKISNSHKLINVVYQHDRITKYELNIEGVGKWISQRILVPEKLTFITERITSLDPFEYMVIINIYERYGDYTKFIYKEEFNVNSDNIEKSNVIFDDISRVVERNMKLIEEKYGIIKGEIIDE